MNPGRVMVGKTERKVSPPAYCQTWPPRDQASPLSPCSVAQCAPPSPAPADGAPNGMPPADDETEDASGHANCTDPGWQRDTRGVNFGRMSFRTD